MFVVFRRFVGFLFLCFHAILVLLGLDGAAEGVQQAQILHLRVDRIGNGVSCPAVRFPADEQEQITVGDLCDIRSRRLEIMRIGSVFLQKHQLSRICMTAENFPHPVILRKIRADDFQFVSLPFGKNGLGFRAAAGQQGSSHKRSKQKACDWFHISPPEKSVIRK